MNPPDFDIQSASAASRRRELLLKDFEVLHHPFVPIDLLVAAAGAEVEPESHPQSSRLPTRFRP